MVQQEVDRVLETTGQQLLVQINGKEVRVGVDCFIAGYDIFLNSTTGQRLVIPDGSRQDSRMNSIFLHLR